MSHPPLALSPVLNRALLAVLILILGYQTYFCVRLQKALGWDPAIGFLTLQSSLEQGKFNRLEHPTPNDLTKDSSEFITWWTPGQYLIPHWAAELFGTDVGFALRIVAAVCCLASMLGYALLYARLGFDRTSVYLSLIVIGSQEYFLENSRVYTGGELLFFAATPYLALGALFARTSILRRAMIAVVISWLGLFLKASALVLFCAFSVCLALESLGWPSRRIVPSGERRAVGRRLLSLAGLFVFFVVVANTAFLSRGTPISASARPGMSLSDRWWGIPVALAGPLSSAFSFLGSFGDRRSFLLLAALSAGLIWNLVREADKNRQPTYSRILVAYYVAVTVFFTYGYLRRMDISYEPRHFRMVGLLAMPGLVRMILSWRRETWRFQPTAVASAIAGLSLISVAVYHRRYHAGSFPADSISRWGIRQPISNASLEALHRLDDTYVTDETIVFNGFGACPSLLLEFKRGRRFQDENFVYLGYNFRGREATPLPWYRNTVRSIALVVPKNTTRYFGAPLEQIAPTFEQPLRIARYFEDDETTIYVGSVGEHPSAKVP